MCSTWKCLHLPGEHLVLGTKHAAQGHPATTLTSLHVSYLTRVKVFRICQYHHVLQTQMCTNNLKQLSQANHSSSLTLPLLLHRAVTAARCFSLQEVSLPYSSVIPGTQEISVFQYRIDVFTNNPWGKKKKNTVPFVVHSFLFIILSMCRCYFHQLYLQEV